MELSVDRPVLRVLQELFILGVQPGRENPNERILLIPLRLFYKVNNSFLAFNLELL